MEQNTIFQPKSRFLFHKHLPLHTFAEMSVSDSAGDVIRTRANFRAKTKAKGSTPSALTTELTGKLLEGDNFMHF